VPEDEKPQVCPIHDEVYVFNCDRCRAYQHARVLLAQSITDEIPLEERYKRKARSAMDAAYESMILRLPSSNSVEIAAAFWIGVAGIAAALILADGRDGDGA
jgi:hypothetical protein